ncbi:serine/threonine protein kinase [Anaeromyxobacter sp. K]|uniref:serine/threonine-protein kinase n=1 Tax=Anaeromyxobacter sp. (strain K) TaxID=447217 RepID=UPI00015F99F2|nr:serine/threonine-protein kinase [Anaeromyxobacter sp. K]ACG72336.1 serine/threonine protein kinase [Anaeromyxobacter sp. K]
MATALDRFRIQGLIGRGGMAEVFRAVALDGPLAGQTVALKRLRPDLARDPGFVALFENEAAVTRRLRHPGIVEVLETGVAEGAPFIVMEYVDGRNLKEILARCGQRGILLPVDFAAYAAHALAEALAHAHAGVDAAGAPLGIVHCDVSPSNVFVSRLGEIKLGDFGVALTPGAAGAPGPGALGKVQYLSPEQLRGERPTPASDLFALGAVLFELLTDRPAFPGRDVNEVGRRILAGEARAPSALRRELPPALDALVLRCLSRDPAQRPASAAAAADEIAALYDPAVGTPLAIAAVVRGLFGAA